MCLNCFWSEEEVKKKCKHWANKRANPSQHFDASSFRMQSCRKDRMIFSRIHNSHLNRRVSGIFPIILCVLRHSTKSKAIFVNPNFLVSVRPFPPKIRRFNDGMACMNWFSDEITL